MFHSILITGGSLEKRIEQAENWAKTPLVPGPDVLIVDKEPSIGINDIRQLEKFLIRKPYLAEQKIVFLPQAEKLTLPAQNAFLKLLEEPPAHSLIILSSPHQHLLLATIISRCHCLKLAARPVSLNPQQLKQIKDCFLEICHASIGARINLASSYAYSKQSALDFSHQQLLLLRYYLVNSTDETLIPLKKVAQLTRHLNQTINKIMANINPKLCVENMFFRYPKL